MSRERCFPPVYLTHWTASQNQDIATQDSFNKEVIRMTKIQIKARIQELDSKKRPTHQLYVAVVKGMFTCHRIQAFENLHSLH